MDSKGFYQKQNLIFKFFIVVLTIIIAVKLDFARFLILFTVVFLFFLLDIRLLRSWLKTLNFTLPLFSSLLFFSLFFELPAADQLQLIIRISFYLLLSVFLTRTIDQVQLVELARRTRKKRLAYQMFYLILATVEIAHYLKIRFDQEGKHDKNFLFVLHNTVTSAFKDLQDLDSKINLQIEDNEIRLNFKPVFADFILMLLLTIEILLYLRMI